MPEETSCKATRAIIQYIRHKAEEDGEDPAEAIDRLLANFPYPAPQNPYSEGFLVDIDHWVELAASDALFERARILLSDEEITYKIAAATPQFKGLFGLTEYLARVVGPDLAMRRTPRLQRALQRTSHLELRRATASQAEIKITYHEAYRANLGRDSCDFARGILSAVPQFAGLKRPARLQETHCTLPIYKRGVIDGYVYLRDGDNYIWRFEWPFKAGEDQIPLPARCTRQSGDGLFEFKTRQGLIVALAGGKIGQLDDEGRFEWNGVQYGADHCLYHLEWQPRPWFSRWLDVLRPSVFRGRAEENLAERQHRIQEMAGSPSSLSLAVVFDDIVKRFVLDKRIFKSKIALLAQYDRPTETLIVRAVAMDLWEMALNRSGRAGTEAIGRYVSLREHQQNLAVKTILSDETVRLAETDDVDKLFRPLIDPDTCQDLKKRVKHLVTIPLRYKKYLVGNLFIATSRPGRLTAPDEDRLIAFAERAAAEIWNAGKYERRVEELTELQQIDQAISSTLNLDEVLRRILTAALRLTEVKHGRVLLRQEPTEPLRPRVGHELSPAKIKSELKIPISDQAKLVGEIQIQSERPAAFDEDDERLLRALAGQAVIAIKNAQQYEALSRERDRRINAEVLSAMIDLSGKMVHRMRGYLGGARSDLEEIRSEYLGEIQQALETLPALNGLTDQVETVAELVDDIYQAVEQALSLVDNLRKPFKIEIGPVSVHESLEKALSDLSRSPGLTLNISEPIARLPQVQGSLEHLTEVFHILLANALEAMPAGGQINVTCSPVCDQKVELTVADTGIGMAEAVMSRIFNYGFTTKTTEKASAGGYGFGLWWVKQYLQRLEGDIIAQSSPGKGSQFRLVLPVWSGMTSERE